MQNKGIEVIKTFIDMEIAEAGRRKAAAAVNENIIENSPSFKVGKFTGKEEILSLMKDFVERLEKRI